VTPRARTLALFLAGCAFLAAGGGSRAAPQPPSIVFFLADDLGWGDLGCFGQRKIRTPNLDRIAREGMRLTRHYAGSAVCAPSRCVLMTGLHPGHAFIRDNRQYRPGGEGQFPVPPDSLTLPRAFRSMGYATGVFGKWGLGAPGTTGEPLRQGFDRFFGFNCQAVAHNHYPAELWEDDRRIGLDNPPFRAHQQLPPGADPGDPTSYAAYSGREYAPDRIGEEALRFIRRHRARPFLLYYATTVPHLALQVPEESLAEYRGRFPETPYRGDRGYLPHPAPRAAYAAMVTRLDRDAGRILALLKELGLDRRTLFVFTSDNGPLYDRLGGTDTEFFDSAAGLRGRKGSLYEGGVRVPCLVRWPDAVPAGEVSERVTGFEDWLPTLVELAGGRPPTGIDGISFARTLRGGVQEPRPFLYREFPGYTGQQSVRVGEWKAVRRDLRRAAAPGGTAPGVRTELYDLEADPTESRDLTGGRPALVARLEALMAREHVPSREFPLPELDRRAE